jgi:metal-dependent hydrolase (beta-lactamase superfamily II)
MTAGISADHHKQSIGFIAVNILHFNRCVYTYLNSFQYIFAFSRNNLGMRKHLDVGLRCNLIREVILTHNHWDHVSGLMTLRKEMTKKNPSALSVVHVARGIFYSRPAPEGEDNRMIAVRKEYEATGGQFIEHEESAEILPGAWLTGPVPRKYPERN